MGYIFANERVVECDDEYRDLTTAEAEAEGMKIKNEDQSSLEKCTALGRTEVGKEQKEQKKRR